MSLRYALLALLTARPLTGYDASKQFSSSVGFVWHAPDSQIYPELSRMEQEGLLRSRELPWGKERVKREYAVTDEGLLQFRNWMNSPLDFQRERDVHHLKAAYLEWAEPSAARRQMDQHIEFHSAQLDRWLEVRQSLLDRTAPTLVQRLNDAPAADHARIVAFKVFAYDGLIARASSEIDWARRGLALLDALPPTKHTTVLSKTGPGDQTAP